MLVVLLRPAPKCFAYKEILSIHRKTHTGEKPYQCNECGRFYISITALKSHVKIHTGEKNYKCLDCGRAFANPCSLRNHSRIHTGEKPHKCPECDKCFSRKYSLVMHQRIHIRKKNVWSTENVFPNLQHFAAAPEIKQETVQSV